MESSDGVVLAAGKLDPGATGQRFRARVLVYPRQEILDPQGKAIGDALDRIGFAGVQEVRAGKAFEIEVLAGDERSAAEEFEEMCKGLLANTVTEDYSVEILGPAGDSTGDASLGDAR